MPPSPQLTPTISFGQVLQIAILVFGIGAGYAMLSSQGLVNVANALCVCHALTNAGDDKADHLAPMAARNEAIHIIN